MSKAREVLAQINIHYADYCSSYDLCHHLRDNRIDDGWMHHEDRYQEFCCVAPPGSSGPKETAPYTHWLEVPPLQTP